MAQTLSHLCTATRAEAMLDHRTRMRSLQRDRWIDCLRATEALQRLERLLNASERERMACTALHGDSNIGKTLIISKLRREHPSTFDELKGVERRQIVAMHMPATPDQHRFYAALLFELGAPHSATASLTTLERLARDLLRRIAPRMLIVDEVHHLLAGGHCEQQASLNLLKIWPTICSSALSWSAPPMHCSRYRPTRRCAAASCRLRSHGGERAPNSGGCSAPSSKFCLCAARRILRSVRWLNFCWLPVGG